MQTDVEIPETTGHDKTNLESSKGTLQRALEAHLSNHDLSKPQRFRMRARLPLKGRGSALLAATDRLWLNLKTYAEGGENTLHAHTNEDHVFIILQGQATFYGPQGESTSFGRHEGILLPRGCTYYFHAEGGEPLVLLRVGCVVDASREPWGRIGGDGKRLPGSSKQNKSVETVFSDEYFL